MPVQHILVGTHTDAIHLVEFDAQLHRLSLKHSLRLRQQPSWITLSPFHPGLFYVNSWTDDWLYAVRVDVENGFEVLSEGEAGGGGPTHMELARDGSALLAVNYRGGSVVRHSLSSDGLFSFSSPRPHHVFHFDYRHPTPPHSRQESSHPHHLISIDSSSKNWLITDLGMDVLWEMSWSGGDEGKWVLVKEHSVDAQTGPRHGMVHQTEQLLYLVNEVSATLSVHRLPSPSSPSSSTSPSSPLALINTFPVLPLNLRAHPRLDGFDRIPSTILLLDPLSTSPPGSPSTLLISNRNAPPELSPEGDSFVQYSISPSDPTKLVDPVFHLGAGLHIRGLAAGPPAGKDKERFVVALGRDYGGMSIYERKEDGSLEVVTSNALGEVEKPVVAVWIP